MRTRPSPHHFEPSHTNSTTTPISGYFELFGVDEGVKQQLYKLASISLCSNTVGQVRAGAILGVRGVVDPRVCIASDVGLGLVVHDIACHPTTYPPLSHTRPPPHQTTHNPSTAGGDGPDGEPAQGRGPLLPQVQRGASPHTHVHVDVFMYVPGNRLTIPYTHTPKHHKNATKINRRRPRPWRRCGAAPRSSRRAWASWRACRCSPRTGPCTPSPGYVHVKVGVRVMEWGPVHPYLFPPHDQRQLPTPPL